MPHLIPRQPRTPAMIRASYDRIGAAPALDGSPPGSPSPSAEPDAFAAPMADVDAGGLRFGEGCAARGVVQNW
jgi:hypothetical protein